MSDNNSSEISLIASSSVNTWSVNFFANLWNVCTVADQRSELLAWLSPLEPWMRHRAVQAHRVSSVGDWLLHTEVFQSWLDVSRQDGPNNTTLFCCGDPGLGKTYIT